MGSRQYSKIGPFMIVKGTIKNTRVDICRQCTNPGCKSKGKESKAKFCGSCGHAIQNVEVEVEEKWDAQDFLYAHDYMENDTFNMPEYAGGVILPSFYPPGGFDRRIDENGGNVDLTGVDMDAEIEWFMKEHAEPIAKLKEAFGEANVQVKWGVVSYWS